MINNGQDCLNEHGTADIVLPIIFLTFTLSPELRLTQADILHPMEEEALFIWMRQSLVKDGVKLTNCFLLFLAAVKKIGIQENSNVGAIW